MHGGKNRPGFPCPLGDNESLEHLLDQGASYETPKLAGDSPLAIASDNGHTECVDLLVKAGAKDSPSKNGRAKPIRRASFMKSKKVKLEMKEEAIKEEVIFEGYLHKKATGLNARWQKRYFVLQGDFFQYFETSTKRKNLKGSLDMKDLTSIELVEALAVVAADALRGAREAVALRERG